MNIAITSKENLSVLLVLMEFNIGGAETYVLNLAKGLKQAGANVCIASNGGAYVPLLEQYGINHYTLPLRSKNPFKMLKAYKQLKRIIKQEKINVMHSHARISSFVCNFARKAMKIPFVTTCHGTYRVSFMLNLLTTWGQRVMAVSSDIQTYLKENYKIPQTDIVGSVNSIDTAQFSPEIDGAPLREQLGIEPDKRVIVCVSRLEGDSCKGVTDMLAIISRLENCVLIIVGSGGQLENIRLNALQINQAAGKTLVHVAGRQTDVSQYLAAADLFVGISRAALEAMSAGKNVILSGNPKYMGLFNEEKLPTAQENNFTCRGCQDADFNDLYNDITRYFAMSDQEKAALAEYNRRLILDEYSLDRMVADNLRLYAMVPKKSLVVSGYYGFKNSGDDALLNAIVASTSKYAPQSSVTVLSKTPKETAALYGVKSISRTNIFKIRKALKNADMLLSGGGSLMQDRTSTKSLFYYLLIIRLAKRYCKVMLYANGIGPVLRDKNKKRVKKALSDVRLITVRDNASAEELVSMGVPGSIIKTTADPTFSLPSAPDRDRLLAECGLETDKPIVGVSLRNWPSMPENFAGSVAKTADYLAKEYNAQILLIPMQYKKDAAICKQVSDLCQTRVCIMENDYTAQQQMAIFSAFDMCLGMRLHSLLYAAARGVPSVGIAYDPKIKGCMEYIGQTRFISIKEADEKSLMALCADCMENREQIKAQLAERVPQLVDLAEENARLVSQILEEC